MQFKWMLLVISLAVAAEAWREKIDPELYERLMDDNAKETVWIDVMGDDSLRELATRGRSTPGEVYHALTMQARKTQAKINEYLDTLDVHYKGFWIKNTIEVKDASRRVVEELAKKYHVEFVRPDEVQYITPMTEVEVVPRPHAVDWNIDIINADNVWAQGITGKQVVVANIDTGVRYTHEALDGNYRGNLGGGKFDHDYNWFDPSGGYETPADGNGHGTHTMGTIGGDPESGISVAPGAVWIAARGCRTSSCYQSDLLGSAQFLLCPTDRKGNNPRCDLAAQVINNSWGGGKGDTWYYDVVDAWRQAGIIPVFSQGNSGSSCGSANSPGDYDIVIGVGATDSNDALASFSSRGPAATKSKIAKQKPDISAPGVSVRSAYSSSDSSYASLSGTSMAGPHVAGAVALYLEAHPGASYDEIYAALIGSAEQALPPPGGFYTECSGVKYDHFPNYFYGYGRLDAEEFVNFNLDKQ